MHEAPAIGRTLGIHDTGVVAVAFANSGKTVYSADDEGFILAWDVESEKSVLGANMFRRGRTIALSATGKVAVVATPNTLKVLDIQNVRNAKNLSLGKRTVNSYPTHVYLTADGGKALLVNWGGSAEIWDLREGREVNLHLAMVGAYYSRDASAIAPDGSRVLIASANRSSIQVRDAESGNIVRTIVADGRGTRAAAFTSNGGEVVTVGFDNSFRRWEVESGKVLARYSYSGMSAVNRVIFSQDNQLMITGHNDGSIVIWDVDNASVLRRFHAHDGWVEAIAISPDGRGLASGGPKGEVRYWNLVDILAH